MMTFNHCCSFKTQKLHKPYNVICLNSPS